ncbi:hypothetical protein CR513_15193, partial [Mucuna pruriens]
MSENKQKKEKHEIECSEEKSKKMSAFAKKKKVESALLAKEKLLVLLYKGIEHQIDIILGCPIPNRPTYITNLKEIKEIQKQVNELLQKGFVRESVKPCYVPVILVPKKDGTWHMYVNSQAINKITKAEFIKELHAKVRANIKKRNGQYVRKQIKGVINDNAYKLDLSTAYGEQFDLRTNPFEEGGNNRNPTNKAKDNLCDTGGTMTRSKTKMVKQSLLGLSLGIKENLEQSEIEAAPKWNVYSVGSTGRSRMGSLAAKIVNEVVVVNNQRLENKITKLTSLVRQLAIGQHHNNPLVRECGMCASTEHPTNICPILKQIEPQRYQPPPPFKPREEIPSIRTNLLCLNLGNEKDETVHAGQHHLGDVQNKPHQIHLRETDSNEEDSTMADGSV